MALERQFSEAWIHNLAPDFTDDDPWSGHFVLGRRLRPFSLWHRLLLREIESPLLDAEKPCSPQDLDRAASICRCRYRQINFAARKSWNPTLLWNIAAGGMKRSADAFADYLKDFCSRPEYEVVPNPNNKSAPPLPTGRPEPELSHAATVIGWSHWPERLVWEMPEGQVEWWSAMAKEAAGMRLDFATTEKRSFESQMDAEIARYAAEKAARKAKEKTNANRP